MEVQERTLTASSCATNCHGLAVPPAGVPCTQGEHSKVCLISRVGIAAGRQGWRQIQQAASSQAWWRWAGGRCVLGSHEGKHAAFHVTKGKPTWSLMAMSGGVKGRGAPCNGVTRTGKLCRGRFCPRWAASGIEQSKQEMRRSALQGSAQCMQVVRLLTRAPAQYATVASSGPWRHADPCAPASGRTKTSPEPPEAERGGMRAGFTPAGGREAQDGRSGGGGGGRAAESGRRVGLPWRRGGGPWARRQLYAQWVLRNVGRCDQPHR